MSYTILIACVAAGWAFLSVLGSAEAAERLAAPPPSDPPQPPRPAEDPPA